MLSLKEKREYLKKNKFGYIYLLLDPRPQKLNEIRYVGKTERALIVRYQEHLREEGTPKCNWIQKLLYLGYKPIYKGLCIVPLEEIDYWEEIFINFYGKLVPSLLNDKLKAGVGGSLSGRKMPDGFGEKISKALKGRNLSKEHIEKIRSALKGKKKSFEHCKKIGEIHRGKEFSESTRNLLSLASIGKSSSFYVKKSMEKFKGIPLKESTKLKISKKSKQIKSRSPRKVGQFLISGELIKIWNSCNTPRKIISNSVLDACKLRISTCKGYQWRYMDEISMYPVISLVR